MGLVSIVIPCFNSVEFIAEAIASAFAQTYVLIEVIVVDDGSTDGSYELVTALQQSDFPNLIIATHPNHENLGVSSTRRRGLLVSSGEYIAFLDADDRFVPEKLEIQVAAMATNPQVVLTHTAVRVIGDRSNHAKYESNFNRHPRTPYQFRKQGDYLQRNGICNSSVVVRIQAIRAVPCAMPQLFQYEDWMCWCLLGAKGLFVHIDQELLEYRVHPGSATAATAKNKLRHYYSLLEFKLALAVKSESSLHSLKCFVSAAQTVSEILEAYGQAQSEQHLGSTNEKPNKLLQMIALVRRFMLTPRRLIQRLRV